MRAPALTAMVHVLASGCGGRLGGAGTVDAARASCLPYDKNIGAAIRCCAAPRHPRFGLRSTCGGWRPCVPLDVTRRPGPPRDRVAGARSM